MARDHWCVNSVDRESGRTLVNWLDAATPEIMRRVEDVTSRIKKQVRKNAAGQAALEALVLEAKNEGQSLRQIADAAKMSPEGVRKMLARITAQDGAD
jgi:hypothetical protein